MQLQRLKFEGRLADLILEGKKTCTWRLWNDKPLQEGDSIELVRKPELTVFAVAFIKSLTTKTMGELTEGDKAGHEEFESDKEMYAVYSQYYNCLVDANSPVTIIHFSVIKFF